MLYVSIYPYTMTCIRWYCSAFCVQLHTRPDAAPLPTFGQHSTAGATNMAVYGIILVCYWKCCLNVLCVLDTTTTYEGGNSLEVKSPPPVVATTTKRCQFATRRQDHFLRPSDWQCAAHFIVCVQFYAPLHDVSSPLQWEIFQSIYSTPDIVCTMYLVFCNIAHFNICF